MEHRTRRMGLKLELGEKEEEDDENERKEGRMTKMRKEGNEQPAMFDQAVGSVHVIGRDVKCSLQVKGVNLGTEKLGEEESSGMRVKGFTCSGAKKGSRCSDARHRCRRPWPHGGENHVGKASGSESSCRG